MSNVITISFHPLNDDALDQSDAGITHRNTSNEDLTNILASLRTRGSFLDEGDVRAGTNAQASSSTNPTSQRQRQCDDMSMLSHLDVNPPGQGGNDGEEEDVYFLQIKQCFKLLLDCGPPDYVKMPILQMISNEFATGGFKADNRDYYYATIWQLVRFMAYITRQSKHLQLVSSVLSEKLAYSTAAKILSSYSRDFGFEPDRAWTVARQHPEVITDPLTEILAIDIIGSSRLAGKFAQRRTNFASLTPPRLQDTPVVRRAKDFAALAGCKHEELRKPGQRSRISEEIFGAILTAVRAVDERLGVQRHDDAYADLVEGLYCVPVATHGEEMLTAGAVTHPRERYGAYLATQTDALCAIGYNTTLYSHRSEESLPLREVPDDAKVDGMMWMSSRVARFQMKSGHEQVFLWNHPVKENGFLDDVRIVLANDYELSFLSISRTEEARLDDMTAGLAHEVFENADVVEAPYAGMQGAQGLGYILSRGYKRFAGIDIVNDAVALTEYATIRDELRMLRSEGIDMSKATMRIYDLETLALPRVVQKKPDNMKVGLYLAAIKVATGAEDVGAEDVTYSRPVPLPKMEGRASTGTSFLAMNKNDNKTIEATLQSKISASETKLDSLRGVREGKILAKASLPYDVILVMIVAIALALVPSFLPGGGKAGERITTGIQNVGTGAVPIIAVYVVVFHYRWGPYDMLRAQRSCETLEEAAKSAGVSEVHIVEELARKGWASEVLSTSGACLPLRGGPGNGTISCGLGLSLKEYAKLGLTVLLKHGAVDRVIGRDSALELSVDSETGIWHAGKANEMYGFYTMADEDDMDIMVGGYINDLM